MIEEFNNFNDFDKEYNWIKNVKEKLLRTALEDKEDYDGKISLKINKFEDEIDINLGENTFDISLIEEMYGTSDSRDNNIKFIKMFIEKEMPYYKFIKLEEYDKNENENDFTDEQGHGFILYFKKFEVKA